MTRAENPSNGRRMNELALFAGVGGGILGSRLTGSRVVCAVEVDPYCREILLRRQEEGHISAFPIWDDVRTFDGGPWRRLVDVVTAGFPCQPFSVAGKQQGADDERNLWPETFRIIQEVRPRHVMLENVPGIRRYLPVVLRDLRRIGYTVKRPITIAAAAVGAGHIRRRVWICADDEGQRVGAGLCSSEAATVGRGRPRDGASPDVPANDLREGIRVQPGRRRRESRPEEAELARTPWWESEPRLARLVRRPANRVERIAATGNIQVPAVVRAAWELLTQ